MAGNKRSFDAATAPAPTPEVLIASVLHLMAHYLAAIDNVGVRASLALAIERHFQTLSILPNLSPILRGTCAQLSEQWGPLVASNSARVTERAARPSILDRLKRRMSATER